MIRLLLPVMALSASVAAEAQSVRFITCPIYRDTDAGRKSGCWLADDAASGHRYDVSRSPTLPDWNYEVLVEGEIASEQDDACGGTVLAPVRVSVLRGGCTRHIIPTEGYKGRRFVLPPRNVRPLSEARAVPTGPPNSRTFHIMYDFDRSFLVYQLSDYLLDEAITYIRFARPARIIVTGHAATQATNVSGRSLAERPQLARTRAENITESLVRLGVPPQTITTRWRTASQPADLAGADGLAEPSRRRVDIEVIVARAKDASS